MPQLQAEEKNTYADFVGIDQHGSSSYDTLDKLQLKDDWSEQVRTSILSMKALADANPEIACHLLSPEVLASNIQALASFRTTSVIKKSISDICMAIDSLLTNGNLPSRDSIHGILNDIRSSIINMTTGDFQIANALREINGSLSGSSGMQIQELSQSIRKLSETWSE